MGYTMIWYNGQFMVINITGKQTKHNSILVGEIHTQPSTSSKLYFYCNSYWISCLSIDLWVKEWSGLMSIMKTVGKIPNSTLNQGRLSFGKSHHGRNQNSEN